jgi:transcription antitermination factor NusG
MSDADHIHPGCQVMVLAGPLKGMSGELLTKADHEWFVVNFENFGNSIQVRVPSNIVKKI